jgi:hypothetical protein
MTIVVTKSMRKKQKKEVIEGRFAKPSNAYDKALTITNQEDVASFHSREQGKLEYVIKHVDLELLRVTGKQPTHVAKLKTL